MKITISILACFLGTIGVAEDQYTIRTNVILKAVHGNRSHAVSRYDVVEGTVMAGLSALQTSQSEDGSWGTDGHRYLATALTLNAFLNHGEREMSPGFGSTVAKAHSWLMASVPSNNTERIASVVALSVFDALHFGGAPRELANREIAKVEEAMSGVSFSSTNIWIDYLTLHQTAPEIKCPNEIRQTWDYTKRWRDRPVEIEPDSITGYVALCSASLGKFNVGGKSWEAFNKELKQKLVQRQMKDGFWPCADPEERFACAALAIESICVYYAWKPIGWPGQVKPFSEIEGRTRSK